MDASPTRRADDVATAPRTTTEPHASTAPRTDPRPIWGRSAKLGGGTGRLLAISLLLGALLAGLLGVIGYGVAALAPDADPARAPLIGLVFGAVTLPIAAAVAWAVLVDRGTLRGAVRDPEESIEGRWLEKAQAGTVTDTLVLLFLVSLPVHFAQWRPDLSLALIALILFMAASTAVRYLLLQRRG